MGGPDPSMARGNLRGKGHPIVKYRDTLWSVGLKSDGTMGQTTGHLEVDTPQATVPSLSTYDGHTTGDWAVALFKRQDSTCTCKMMDWQAHRLLMSMSFR